MSATNIYDLHSKAFDNVSAYVICKDGERVATVAFRFPRDGAGRLWCYLHVLGVPMVRAYASGYGYDKKSAACVAASHKVEAYTGEDRVNCPKDAETRDAICNALSHDGGMCWDRYLLDAG